MTSIETAVWDDVGRISSLVPQWRTLRGAGITTIFGSPDWVLAAWQHLPSLGKPLLLTACSNGQLLGLMPLAVTRRSDGTRLLHYAGSPLTDKCDTLAAPGDQDLALKGILHAVRSALGPHDVLRISELDREGLLAGVLARRDLRNDFGLAVEQHAGDLSPVISIMRAGAVDRRWQPASRAQWDNRRRWLARQGNLRFARQASMRDFETEMRAFVRNRLDRWNQRGRLDELPDVEREAGFEEFLTQCCTRLAARGCCFLAHLLLDGAPVI